MSSHDADPPRKTLTLNRATRPKRDTPDAQDKETRKRAGARARQVAQQQRLEQKAAPAPQPPSRAPSQAPSHDAASQAPRPKRSAPQRPVPQGPASEAPPPDDAKPRRSPRPRPAEPFAARPAEPETYPVFASCPQGMEEALCVELQALGFDDASADRAGVRFHADWAGVQRANLYSRLATRVLVEVAHAPVRDEDDILALAQAVPWERWFGPEHTLRVDTSAIRSPMKSLQYCNLRAKDGICDRLREREGARPNIDTVRPDARVHLFLSADSATLYLDTSGESLFKRGWRLEKGEAPLRENLAAGLLALAGWDPAGALMDPFCGSGTLLIEAAWIALGVPPGISRPFGFERLRDHDVRAWEHLRQEARANILPRLDAPLLGVDLDPEAVAAAQRNAERAWLSADSIRFEVGDAREVLPPAESGWIVTNPPYGERLAAEEAPFWQEWSSHLKRHYAGWHLAVITSDMRFPQALRLKEHRRTPVHNGALECRLFSFDLVAGTNRHKRGA